MKDTLIIRILYAVFSSDSARPAYVIDINLSPDGEARKSFNGIESETLASLLLEEAFSPERIILLVPEEKVLISDVFVPSKQKKQIDKATPYLLEDRLISDIDDTCFKIIKVNEDKSVVTLTVSQEELSNWWHLINGLNTTAEFFILPEGFALPYSEHEIDIYISKDEGKAMCKVDQFHSFACHTENLPLFLDRFLQSSREKPSADTAPPKIIIHPDNESKIRIIEDKLKSELPALTSYDVKINFSGKNIFQLMVDQLLAASGAFLGDINLAHREFSNNNKSNKSELNWKRVCYAALFLISIQLISNLAVGYSLNAQAEKIGGETRALYRELFPEDLRIVNIRTQMENHLADLSFDTTDSGFIVLLSSFSQYLSPDTEIQFIRYSSSNNQLLIEILANSLSQLDTLESQINRDNVSAEITSANQDGAKIRGRISVSLMSFQG